MGRWTYTREEEKKLVETQKKLFDHLFKPTRYLRISLDNEEVIEGFVVGINYGNNAGEGGHWCFHGDITLETPTDGTINIDCLNIKDIQNILHPKG